MSLSGSLLKDHMCVDGGETLDRGRIESMSRAPLLLVESRKVIVCPNTAGGYFSARARCEQYSFTFFTTP